MINRPYALGYSTCGFAAGRPMLELVQKLATLGYSGVELELDRERFHPHVHSLDDARSLARACKELGLRTVLGTGGRHVLTSRRHYPSAVAADARDRGTWVDFIRTSLDWAAEMGAECIMVHSGYTPDDIGESAAWDLLVKSMSTLAEHAKKVEQRVAVEWHPEMFLRTADQFLQLAADVGNDALKCTLDVGHAHCTEKQTLREVIAKMADFTIHVQLEDMRDRVHKHLPLGRGELDFEEIFSAFDQTNYRGVVALEFNAGDLGGNGDELASQSIEYLTPIFADRITTGS